MAKVQISELVLRDAHQSLFATRMTTKDMLPACSMIDKIGYWAAEAWGGATYDSCIRFLNEDPWERLRTIKAHVSSKYKNYDAFARAEFARLQALCG